MAHHINTSGYSRLVERLNRFPQGAPSSDLLYQILKILFSEKEAEKVALLPIRPFSLQKAARIWKLNPDDSRKILDDLASRAILIDFEIGQTRMYCLPPPMAGFFEFSMMRVRDDIDQKTLSELFYQYLNVEDDFVRELFTKGETQLGRVFVNEESIPPEYTLQVLDYERAGEVIRTSRSKAVSLCYCRHKMSHLNKACNAPLEICMTFGTVAQSLVQHGHARAIDSTEGLDLLHKAWEHNLVQFGENVRQDVSFICNCCSCCCEAMIATRRFAILHPVHTTNFLPEIDPEACIGCGRCSSVCPVEAVIMIPANNSNNPKLRCAQLNPSLCLGCGICVRVCPQKAIHLHPRPARVITPVNNAHRIIMMAIERGKLQELIFDNRVMWHYRAMATLLGVILKLPPLQQALASRQVKSRFLEKLLSRQAR